VREGGEHRAVAAGRRLRCSVARGGQSKRRGVNERGGGVCPILRAANDDGHPQRCRLRAKHALCCTRRRGVANCTERWHAVPAHSHAAASGEGGRNGGTQRTSYEEH
jgi:hypothetical protein